MKIAIIQITFVLLSSVVFNSCKEEESIEIIKEKVSGFVQGPFINGSSVEIFDLKSSLNPTGRLFSTSVADNNGYFEINNIKLSSPFVKFKVTGFYFNEVSGTNTTELFTLNAICDVSDNENINVNILTHMEESRVEYLVSKGIPFSKAKDSAQYEVFSIFNFTVNALENSEKLNISVDKDNNALLLAISVILQGDRNVVNYSQLVADMISDIREDGVLNNENIKSDLYNSTQKLDLIKIRGNLEKYYQNNGAEAAISDFERYINDFLLSKKPFDIGANISEVTCHGMSNGKIEASVIGGTPPYSYSWSNGAISKEILDLVAGIYSVTVTDSKKYRRVKQIEIKEPADISITGIVIHPVRTGAQGSINVNITGGTPPYIYEWSNGESTMNLNDLSAGKYQLQVTDKNQCARSQEFLAYYTVKDFEGNEYNTIDIGSQTWMRENLKSTRYNDGTPITLITDKNTWNNSTTGAYCWYTFNEVKYKADYGAMYNWDAVNTTKLCPVGWHVPTNGEWSILIDLCGGEWNAGPILRESGVTHWESPNTGTTNDYDFTALPGGYNQAKYTFYGIGQFGYWWSATESSDLTRAVNYQTESGVSRFNQGGFEKKTGLSVRCLKD